MSDDDNDDGSMGTVEHVAEALDEAGLDAGASDMLVTAALFEQGASTIDQITEQITSARITVYKSLRTLVDAGLANKDAGDANGAGQGRDPDVYSPAGPLEDKREPGDTGSIEERKRRVIEALARIHYHKGISSARSSQVATHTVYSSRAVAPALKQLEHEGVAETVNDYSTTTKRYRLIGAGEYAPYAMPGDDE